MVAQPVPNTAWAATKLPLSDFDTRVQDEDVDRWTGGMSIEDLKKALAVEKPRAAVVVSTKLFRQLYEAAELRPRKQRWEPTPTSNSKSCQ